MDNRVYLDLMKEVLDGQMLCAGRIVNILHYALQGSALPGDMVEFGCHIGRTGAILAHTINKPLWLYDSFEGLPERRDQDGGALEQFKRGALAVEVKHVEELFARHKLPKPNVYKSWFKDIPPDKLPERVCFAHLDGDLYDSIRDSLQLVYPRLVPGAACIVDDYGWEGLPGAKVATDEFLADKPEKAVPLVTGRGWHALILKI